MLRPAHCVIVVAILAMVIAACIKDVGEEDLYDRIRIRQGPEFPAIQRMPEDSKECEKAPIECELPKAEDSLSIPK